MRLNVNKILIEAGCTAKTSDFEQLLRMTRPFLRIAHSGALDLQIEAFGPDTPNAYFEKDVDGQ